MRILIIGINYLPEKTGIGPYTAALAAYMAERNHCVEVLTGLPSYPEWKVHDTFRHTVWKKDFENGVVVHRRWHYVPRLQSAFRRLAYELTFLLTGFSSILLTRPDLVVGVVPALSGGVLARLVARRFGVRYALIFQDLMGPAASQTGVSGGDRVASLVTWVERWISRGAAAVVVIAEGFRPHLESFGVNPANIRHVRNWTRTGQGSGNRATTRERLGWDQHQVVCLHAGNMGHKQALENILECARLAQERDKDYRFILMGDGNQRQALEKLATALELSNVDFLALQPEETFPDILAAADVLLLNQRVGVSEMALPSKITSYLASGRPVIAAVEMASETARELIASEAGIVTKPEDPEALLSAISGLASDAPKQELLGTRGKTHAADVLSAEAALLELEQVFMAIS